MTGSETLVQHRWLRAFALPSGDDTRVVELEFDLYTPDMMIEDSSYRFSMRHLLLTDCTLYSRACL